TWLNRTTAGTPSARNARSRPEGFSASCATDTLIVPSELRWTAQALLTSGVLVPPPGRTAGTTTATTAAATTTAASVTLARGPRRGTRVRTRCPAGADPASTASSR